MHQQIKTNEKTVHAINKRVKKLPFIQLKCQQGKKKVEKKQYNKWRQLIKHPSIVDIDELFKSLCDTVQDAELVVCIIMEKKKSLLYSE